MRTFDVRITVAVAAALALAACGEKKAPPAEGPAMQQGAAAQAPRVEAAPAPAAPAAAPTVTPSPTATPAPSAAPTTTPAPAPVAPKPAPAPEAKAPPAAPAPAAPPPAPKAVPTAPAAPAATPPAATPPAAGHAKVGADKCKMCHRIQHQSWAASPHATKGLDCEGCHGNGGDYWPATVMRDRAKAAAAGLVTPTLASCKKCHAKADDALFAKVHAHKAK